MAKKLKKKIEEICGLVNLDAEARQARAKDILASKEWKQQLCNELIGLSFKQLERTLNGVITERTFRSEEEKVFKNEKLKTYRDNKSSGQRTSRDDIKANSSGSKIGPRSLEEILAQVYGPRRDTLMSDDERVQFSSLRASTSSDELLSDSFDENCEAE